MLTTFIFINMKGSQFTNEELKFYSGYGFTNIAFSSQFTNEELKFFNHDIHLFFTSFRSQFTNEELKSDKLPVIGMLNGKGSQFTNEELKLCCKIIENLSYLMFAIYQ